MVGGCGLAGADEATTFGVAVVAIAVFAEIEDAEPLPFDFAGVVGATVATVRGSLESTLGLAV
jgi:hypothetical protein